MELIDYSNLKPGWVDFFKNESQQKYFIDILNNVKKQYSEKLIYPPMKLLFNAFYITDLNDIKVVIIGREPYHGARQANGLAFAVSPGVIVPPSLQNIFKEVEVDLEIIVDKQNGDLTRWANQGVFLLNAILSIEKGKPCSHQKLNWEQFTDKVITFISEKLNNIVFILWGDFANQKKHLIKNANNHLILKSGHPSFFTQASFFGNLHFLKTDAYLYNKGRRYIDFS